MEEVAVLVIRRDAVHATGGETGIASQRIPDRLGLEPVDAHTSFRAGPEPVERSISLTQPERYECGLEGRRRVAHLFQIRHGAPGIFVAPAAGSCPQEGCVQQA